MIYDGVIAGAGPVGLFLACALRLAACSVLVLEQAKDLHRPSPGAAASYLLIFVLPAVAVFSQCTCPWIECLFIPVAAGITIFASFNASVFTLLFGHTVAFILIWILSPFTA